MAQCSSYNGDWIQPWVDFAFQDAILCPFAAQFGGLEVFALLFIGGINLGLYGKQETVLLPLVNSFLVGGFFVSQATSVYSQALTIAVVFLVGVAPVLVARRLEVLR